MPPRSWSANACSTSAMGLAGHQIEDNTRKVVEELIGGRPFVVKSYPLGSRFPAA